MKNVHLLIVDMQNDFCETQAKGAQLSVAGANGDAERLAKFIGKNTKKISDIHATLDSHNTIHVAHPIFWINSKGDHPGIFSLISADDVKNGVWMTTNPAWRQRGIDYVTTLARNGRYPLCIWPAHCLISRWGHAIFPCVGEALTKWENDNFGIVDFCVKGSNFFTENYSVVKADVPDPSDPSTMLNTELIKVLQDADDILVSGEALSHCVRNTVVDIADNFGEENIKKLVLLKDTSSSVGGFEKLGDDFVRDMVKRGMRISSTTDYFA